MIIDRILCSRINIKISAASYFSKTFKSHYRTTYLNARCYWCTPNSTATSSSLHLPTRIQSILLLASAPQHQPIHRLPVNSHPIYPRSSLTDCIVGQAVYLLYPQWSLTYRYSFGKPTQLSTNKFDEWKRAATSFPLTTSTSSLKMWAMTIN